MNIALPLIEPSNLVFQQCSPSEFNKSEINSSTIEFETKLQKKLQAEDYEGCVKLAQGYVNQLQNYLKNTANLDNSFDSLIAKYADRFLDQLSQFLPRTARYIPALDVPDGSIVSTAKYEVVDKINSLLRSDIAFVKSKEPRIDFAGYDRCKIFKKRKILNQYSKLGKLDKILRYDPEYKKYIFDKGFDLHSFTLHYSTSADVVHYQFGLWREPQNRQKLSDKYLQSHYDPDPENIKSIFYLSDVQEISQGPFKYFKGSARISPDNILERISGATMCGINLLETHENRVFFAALPDKLMHHNIFGSLLDQRQLDEINLDKSLLPIYGTAGTFILFDPLGIHSGGLCTQEKTRLNLQMIFKKK
ncbi:hypothetical protein N9501_08270 [Amylibacter sp.]|nr:hypothetical protein [Amylibacter sp.]